MRDDHKPNQCLVARSSHRCLFYNVEHLSTMLSR
jgi:hypothetical protein